MEVEESILMKQNNRPQESIEGKIVHFKPSVEDVHQRSRPVPLDVYGKPEIYRWRTAYDEAYNMDSQGRWKYE